ncbi:tyrosine-type recombinase/integrase [Dysgonomonas macrotermitis]|uniref:Site-specific recombinase XerD n=1 Tax=Dysgonomonas macrotermitis TaxID=1346286 RepID=A0A1M4UMK4_9BACT|nr:tyrosine-type recombinase/integrase [Dysgonomonas macrotermitis]SHE57914.1 Site-specific recombinase XerD [Dysgonomonas macrotermitis]
MNFKDLSELWIKEHSVDIKISTLSIYRLSLKNWILPYFGNKNQVSNQDAQDWVDLQLSTGKMSQKTIKDALIVLQMVLKYGKREGIFEYSGQFYIKYPRVNVKDVNKKLEVLAKPDFKKLKLYLEDNFSFPNLGILIAMHTGMRIGEICGLRWSDINLQEGVVTVNRTMQRVNFDGEIHDTFSKDELQRYADIDGLEMVIPGRQYKNRGNSMVIISNPKTANANRDIPLSSNLIKIFKKVDKLLNNKEVFVITGNEYVSEPRTYRNYFYNLLDKLSIPRIKFHGIRHTFATYCIESGADIKTTSLMLGHSDVSITLNVYVNPDMKTKRAVINKIFK